MTARIGNESFTNFILLGRYWRESFSKGLFGLCLVLQLIVITVISVFAVIPLLYWFVKLAGII